MVLSLCIDKRGNMKKYAKVINEETKACQVGTGTDTDYYEKLGMELLDVEKCEWNGGWYLSGHIPTEPSSHKKQKRTDELKKQLKELDEKSARAVRAILAGTATDEDKTLLADIETQAEALRQQIKKL